jgi:acyl transferase domain-containing protein
LVTTAAASVDTACSSALVAMQCATHAGVLERVPRLNDRAVAAALSLEAVAARRADRLASGDAVGPGGRCKTLDAAADGYVRSEV